MHLVDVLLPELARLHQEGGQPINALSFHHLLAPFYLIMSHCHDTTVIRRVTQGVFQAIIQIAREGDHVLRSIILDMLPTMSDKVFRLASAPDIQDSMRNRLYALRAACKELIVQHNLDEADIFDDTIDDEGDEGEEGDAMQADGLEVDELPPTLVPIEASQIKTGPIRPQEAKLFGDPSLPPTSNGLGVSKLPKSGSKVVLPPKPKPTKKPSKSEIVYDTKQARTSSPVQTHTVRSKQSRKEQGRQRASDFF